MDCSSQHAGIFTPLSDLWEGPEALIHSLLFFSEEKEGVSLLLGWLQDPQRSGPSAWWKESVRGPTFGGRAFQEAQEQSRKAVVKVVWMSEERGGKWSSMCANPSPAALVSLLLLGSVGLGAHGSLCCFWLCL